MKLRFEILRRAPGEAEGRVQAIDYETNDPAATVATALMDMNRAEGLADVEGRPVGRVVWECSCLQKKCGACAMRVNGVPKLACDAKLAELGGVVRLEPLRKFPVVADLMVDRSVLRENLKALRLWLERDVTPSEKAGDIAYEASRCLQCGCCLEVCPNYLPGGAFLSAAAMVPASRLIAELAPARREALYRQYSKRFYGGCGKSLSCRDICPAGIDTERLLVNSNAIAVWKRLR